jgi:hypothetical protein
MRSLWSWQLLLGAGIVLAIMLTPPSQAQEAVADLTVIAYGAQLFDLNSGRTLMEDGGEIVERSSGVSIVAQWMSYLPEVDIEIRGGVLEGPAGRVEAAFMQLDLVAQRVTASGGVSWQQQPLEAVGDELLVLLGEGLAGLRGHVVSHAPELRAQELWIDLEALRMFLIGPYEYRDGPFLLTGSDEALLQIDPVPSVDGDEEAPLVFDARSEADPESVQRLLRVREAWLPADAP